MSSSSSSATSSSNSANTATELLQPRQSNMVPSIQDVIKSVNADYKKVYDSCNVLLFRLESIKSCREQKLLPHNLRLTLAPCQYPSFMDKDQIESARQRELRMFEVCLYKIEQDRYDMFQNAETQAIQLCSNWKEEEYVADHIRMKASSEITVEDINYGIQEFSAYHTLLHDRNQLSKARAAKKRKRQRTSSPTTSDADSTDTVPEQPIGRPSLNNRTTKPAHQPITDPTPTATPAVKKTKANRNKSPGRDPALSVKTLANQLEQLTLSMRDLQEKFQGTLRGGQRATTPPPITRTRQPQTNKDRLTRANTFSNNNNNSTNTSRPTVATYTPRYQQYVAPPLQQQYTQPQPQYQPAAMNENQHYHFPSYPNQPQQYQYHPGYTVGYTNVGQTGTENHQAPYNHGHPQSRVTFNTQPNGNVQY